MTWWVTALWCLVFHILAVTIWTLHRLMFTLWRPNIITLWSVICIQDIALFWRHRTGLVLVLLCHWHLVDMADLSLGSEVLTRLNRCRSPGYGIGRPGLRLTKQCWPISGTWGIFLTLHDRGRSHFLFRKRTWRHPRWQAEAEMAPALVMERQESHLDYSRIYPSCGFNEWNDE